MYGILWSNIALLACRSFIAHLSATNDVLGGTHKRSRISSVSILYLGVYTFGWSIILGIFRELVCTSTIGDTLTLILIYVI